MDKQISQYLHLYLGCEVEIPDNHVSKGGFIKSTRKGTFLGFADYHRLECRIGFRAGPEGRVSTFFLRPILKPLSDMTEEEMRECGNMDYDFSDSLGLNTWTWKDFDCLLTPNQFVWLLSKQFDLFGLIESGLAIDKTKL